MLSLWTRYWAPFDAVVVKGAEDASGKPIHLIGLKFSREQRQIVAYEVALADSAK